MKAGQIFQGDVLTWTNVAIAWSMASNWALGQSECRKRTCKSSVSFCLSLVVYKHMLDKKDDQKREWMSINPCFQWEKSIGWMMKNPHLVMLYSASITSSISSFKTPCHRFASRPS